MKPYENAGETSGYKTINGCCWERISLVTQSVIVEMLNKTKENLHS